MRAVYTIGIFFYALGVRVAALLGHRRAKPLAAGWRSWREALAKLEPGRPTVWFHAASLGEFEQARPVLEEYRRRRPGHQVLLTFFSPSGYEVRKDYAQADAVCYLPPDLPRNARRLVQAVKPEAAYFVKYEFWFNHLDALRRAGVKTYIFSAIFRPRQYFFSWYGAWFRRQLGRCFTHLYVQNEESLALLKGHGIGHCTLAGDTRYDRVAQIVGSAPRNGVVEAFLGDTARSVVAGSTWPPDEELLARWRSSALGDTKLIIAPHLIHEEHLRQIEALFPNSVRYSLCAGRDSLPENADTLIIDNIGMLSQLYRYGRVAYIGGGFGVGIHNILEAVAYGRPVLFGPNYAKFQEARDLIGLGGAWSIGRDDDGATLTRLLDDPSAYGPAQEACRQLMDRNTGATDIILNNN